MHGTGSKRTAKRLRERCFFVALGNALGIGVAVGICAVILCIGNRPGVNHGCVCDGHPGVISDNDIFHDWHGAGQGCGHGVSIAHMGDRDWRWDDGVDANAPAGIHWVRGRVCEVPRRLEDHARSSRYVLVGRNRHMDENRHGSSDRAALHRGELVMTLRAAHGANDLAIDHGHFAAGHIVGSAGLGVDAGELGIGVIAGAEIVSLCPRGASIRVRVGGTGVDVGGIDIAEAPGRSVPRGEPPLNPHARSTWNTIDIPQAALERGQGVDGLPAGPAHGRPGVAPKATRRPADNLPAGRFPANVTSRQGNRPAAGQDARSARSARAGTACPGAPLRPSQAAHGCPVRPAARGQNHQQSRRHSSPHIHRVTLGGLGDKLHAYSGGAWCL